MSGNEKPAEGSGEAGAPSGPLPLLVRRVVVALNHRQYLAYLKDTGMDPNLCRYIGAPCQLSGLQLGPKLQLVKLPDWWQRPDRSDMAYAMRCLENTSA